MTQRAAVYEAVGHLAVRGWIEPEILGVVRELSLAQRAEGIVGSVVEIGVHHGRLFLALHLNRAPGERSVALDLYEMQSDNVDGSGHGDRQKFRANLRRWAGSEDDVAVLAADSTSVTPERLLTLAGSQVRLFSVDGGHTADIVESDMALAAASAGPGAIVLGDDVFNAQWPGAHDGTSRYLAASPNLVPFGIGFNKTMFTDVEHVERYRTVLRDVARRRLWFQKDSEMAGYPVTVIWRPPARARARMAGRRVLDRR